MAVQTVAKTITFLGCGTKTISTQSDSFTNVYLNSSRKAKLIDSRRNTFVIVTKF